MINDETRELNPGGRQALKQLIDAYQDPKKLDKIGQIQKSVDSIKIDMKDYIVKMIYCEENVKDLENTTKHLQLESNQCQKNSQEIRTITWWQNIWQTTSMTTKVWMTSWICALTSTMSRKPFPTCLRISRTAIAGGTAQRIRPL